MKLKKNKIRGLVRKEEPDLIPSASKKFAPLVSSALSPEVASSGRRIRLLQLRFTRMSSFHNGWLGRDNCTVIARKLPPKEPRG
jgi:hypothetical protein